MSGYDSPPVSAPSLAESARLERQIARLQQRLDWLASRPEDDFPDGAVLAWDKQFAGSTGGANRVSYHYAAVKARGRWYVTGSRARHGGLRWDDLLSFIEEDAHSPVTLWWATEFEEVD